jgi:outer membrane protein OmpA-like peptidoglycan-associated protein
VLTRASQERLEQIAKQAAANPDAHLKVSGYTDDVGNEDRNRKLLQTRADKVRASPVQQGVAGDRVAAQGFAEANPVGANDSRQGRAASRRVIVTIE